MGSRRPAEPFSPISPNIIPTKYTFTKVSATVENYQPMYSNNMGNGSNSGSSNDQMEALDDLDTDDSFGRKIIRTMAQESVDNMRSARPIAFRKSRPRPGGRLTLENLKRISPKQEFQSLDRPFSPPASIASHSSIGSNPPLNVPRQWGTRAKRGSNWLRRKNMQEPERPSRAETSGEVDWLDTAADVPLPSIDDSPLSRRGSTRGTPAPSTKRQNDSLDRIADLEFDDLDGASLLASTPAAFTRKPAARNTALDEIRQLELENKLEEESIFATAQAEDSEKQPDDQTSKPAKIYRDSLSVRRTTQQNMTNLTQTWAHPAEQEIGATKRTRTVVPCTADGPPSPISLHKAPHTTGQVDREVTPQIQKSPKRPEHHREDSQVILRRLARAASGTPSPARVSSTTETATSEQNYVVNPSEAPKMSTDAQTNEQNRDVAQDIRVRFAQLHPSRSTAMAMAKANKNDQAVVLAEQELKNAPAVSQKRQAKAAEPVPTVDETIISAPVLDPKTPIVTGAWIDTPKTARPTTMEIVSKLSPMKSALKKRGSAPAKKADTSSGKATQSSEPQLPSSALAAIVDEARSNFRRHSEDALGETTINSLEDLIVAPADESILNIEEDTLDKLQLPPTKPTTSAGKLREQEVKQLQSMNEHLRNTQRSLRDVRHGIQRVGNQVEHKTPSPPTPVQQIGKCDDCANPAYRLWMQAKDALYTRPNGQTQLTWAGITLFTFLIWLITELLLCILYCRPVYSKQMHGFGIQPIPLQPPFVIPSLLLRPFGPLWRPVVNTIYTFLHWLWGFVVYVVTSSGEETFVEEKKNTVVEEIITQTAHWETDWSMMNDEVL
ncbi:hypothetical protein EJ08DRAFT_192614 [Tothia fuscella]|uniref:Uncharacterized protein n=1 Tax=Tothia fuscella TaxID=1048955 RepID=A0A9P4NT64_9PEZI|nr:hypothetical protein EJ08DRAFT_192614 [Tothia fuscella]